MIGSILNIVESQKEILVEYISMLRLKMIIFAIIVKNINHKLNQEIAIIRYNYYIFNYYMALYKLDNNFDTNGKKNIGDGVNEPFIISDPNGGFFVTYFNNQWKLDASEEMMGSTKLLDGNGDISENVVKIYVKKYNETGTEINSYNTQAPDIYSGVTGVFPSPIDINIRPFIHINQNYYYLMYFSRKNGCWYRETLNSDLSVVTNTIKLAQVTSIDSPFTTETVDTYYKPFSKKKYWIGEKDENNLLVNTWNFSAKAVSKGDSMLFLYNYILSDGNMGLRAKEINHNGVTNWTISFNELYMTSTINTTNDKSVFFNEIFNFDITEVSTNQYIIIYPDKKTWHTDTDIVIRYMTWDGGQNSYGTINNLFDFITTVDPQTDGKYFNINAYIQTQYIVKTLNNGNILFMWIASYSDGRSILSYYANLIPNSFWGGVTSTRWFGVIYDNTGASTTLSNIVKTPSFLTQGMNEGPDRAPQPLYTYYQNYYMNSSGNLWDTRWFAHSTMVKNEIKRSVHPVSVMNNGFVLTYVLPVSFTPMDYQHNPDEGLYYTMFDNNGDMLVNDNHNRITRDVKSYSVNFHENGFIFSWGNHQKGITLNQSYGNIQIYNFSNSNNSNDAYIKKYLMEIPEFFTITLPPIIEGEENTISWMSYAINGNISIYLMSESDTVNAAGVFDSSTIIVQNIANTGSYDWNTLYYSNTPHKIRIQSDTDSSKYSDSSETTFTKPEWSIIQINATFAPNHAFIYFGNTHTITWNYSNNINLNNVKSMKLELIEVDTPTNIYTIVDNIDPTLKTYPLNTMDLITMVDKQLYIKATDLSNNTVQNIITGGFFWLDPKIKTVKFVDVGVLNYNVISEINVGSQFILEIEHHGSFDDISIILLSELPGYIEIYKNGSIVDNNFTNSVSSSYTQHTTLWWNISRIILFVPFGFPWLNNIKINVKHSTNNTIHWEQDSNELQLIYPELIPSPLMVFNSSYEIGESLSIHWDFSGIISVVSIELLGGLNSLASSTIKAVQPADTPFHWVIPQINSGMYQIRINNITNCCTQKKHPSIIYSYLNVVKPLFTNITIQTPILHSIPSLITWTNPVDVNNAINTNNIELFLMKNNTTIKPIKTNAISPFSWTLPFDDQDISGTNYYIQIHDNENIIDDVSSNEFEIEQIKFNTLTIPINLSKITNNIINWEHTGIISNIKLNIFQPNVSYSPIYEMRHTSPIYEINDLTEQEAFEKAIFYKASGFGKQLSNNKYIYIFEGGGNNLREGANVVNVFKIYYSPDWIYPHTITPKNDVSNITSGNFPTQPTSEQEAFDMTLKLIGLGLNIWGFYLNPSSVYFYLYPGSNSFVVPNVKNIWKIDTATNFIQDVLKENVTQGVSSTNSSQNEFLWNLGNTTFGPNYKLQITDSNNRATPIFASKVGLKPMFTINTTAIFTHTQIFVGKPYTVTWSTNTTLSNFNIILLHSGIHVKILESNISSTDEEINTTIILLPFDLNNSLSPSDNYLRLQDVNGIADFIHSNIFTIIKTEITSLELRNIGGFSIGVVNQGENYLINWDYSGYMTDIKIDLYQNETFKQNLYQNIDPTSKQKSWSVSYDYNTYGSDFKLKITLIDTIFIFSAPFLINKPNFSMSKSDIITGPVLHGIPTNISWSYNLIIKSINILLMKSAQEDILVKTINAPVGSYDWTFPLSQKEIYGSDFYILITDLSGNANDISSNKFNIFAPKFNSIEIPTNVTQTQSAIIEWNYSGNINSVVLEAVNDSGVVHPIKTVDSYPSQYPWIPELSPNIAGIFKIRITDISGYTTNESNTFNIIKPTFKTATLANEQRVLHGIPVNIEWTYSLVIKSIRLQLIGLNETILIQDNVNVDDLSYAWTFPLNNNLSGKGFQIKITDLSGNANPITIDDVELIYPKFQNLSNNTVYQGIENIINWDYSGNISNVKLELWKDTKVMDISTNNINTENCNDCILQWTMDYSKHIFGDYQIKLYDVSDNATNISSNVTIVKPEFNNITFGPNGRNNSNSEIYQGHNNEIHWITNGLQINKTNIELWDDSGWRLNIEKEPEITINSWGKSFIVKYAIPKSTLVHGDNFYIKLSDDADIANEISSYKFTIIKKFFDSLYIEPITDGTETSIYQGIPIYIKWTNNIFTIKEVTIDLEFLDSNGNIIKTKNIITQRQYSKEAAPGVFFGGRMKWCPDYDDYSGNNHRFIISDFNDVAIDYPSEVFEIVAPKLTSFTVPDTVYQNHLYDLKWDYTGIIDNVNIKFKNDDFNIELNNISGKITGWKPPLHTTLHGQYKLVITHNANDVCNIPKKSPKNVTYFESNTFTIIKPKFNEIELIHKNIPTWCPQNTPLNTNSNIVYQECPIDISWNTNASTINNVHLELWRPNTRIKIIESNISNLSNFTINTFQWVQDNSANAIHDDYFIKIKDVKGIADDISSNTFTIIKPKFSSLNLNSTVNQGKINTITWNFDLYINNINLELIKDDVSVGNDNIIFNSSLKASLKTVGWTPPLSNTIAGNYKIRISDVDNIATDISSSEFVIIKPSFTKPILSTNRVLHGIPVTITWNYELDIGNVRIELWKNTSIEKIGELTEFKKSFSWNLPLTSDHISGTDYTIKIFDTNENADPKESDTFEIIAPEFKTLTIPTIIDQNKEYIIEWDYSGNISNVKIQYIDATNSILIHESIVAFNKQIPWKPPLSNTVHGSGFKILITDVAGNATEKESNPFTLVRPKFNKIELFHPNTSCVNFNSNEVFLSCPVDISWNTNNVTIDKVKLELWRNNNTNPILHIADVNTQSGNTYIYTLETKTKLSTLEIENYDDYYIKITDDAGHAEETRSSDITIVKSLFESVNIYDIVSPSSPITDISQNIQVKIKWVYNLDTNNRATISILNSDESVRQVITNNVNIQDVSYNWVPDLNNNMEGSFILKINDNSNPLHSIDSTIKIIKPSFTSATLSNYRILQGLPINISWTQLLTIENIKIQLEDSNGCIIPPFNDNRTAIFDTIDASINEKEWVPPFNDISGTGFKIIISDVDGYANYIKTDPFDIIAPKFKNISNNTIYQEIPNTISWDYSGNISNIKLELWKDSLKVKDISTNISTDCFYCDYIWTLDNSKNRFDTHTIKLFDVANNAPPITTEVTVIKPIFKMIRIYLTDSTPPVLYQGKEKKIEWVTNGLKIDSTKIQLYKDDVWVKDIGIKYNNTIVNNDLSYFFNFKQEHDNTIHGDNFYIKISDISNIATDISSSLFTIKKPYFDSISLVSLEDSTCIDTVLQGKDVYIKWTNFIFTIENVKLELLLVDINDNILQEKEIIDKTRYDDEFDGSNFKYKWCPAYDDYSGNKLKIRISDIGGVAEDYSSNVFEIIAPKLSSFTVPDTMYQNRSYNLHWDYSGKIDNVNIKFENDDFNIELNNVSGKITGWKPPLHTTLHGQYKLVITDNGNNTCKTSPHSNITYFESNEFTIIKPKFNGIELIHKNLPTWCSQNTPLNTPSNIVYQECPIDISWNTNNTTIDEIRLELWRNINPTENIKIKTIKNNVITSGYDNEYLTDDTFKFSWTQDNSANAIHDDYYIRLFDTKDIADDISSSKFTIVKPKFLSLSLNSENTEIFDVSQNKEIQINWDFDLSINNIKLELFKVGFNDVLKATLKASDKFFNWTPELSNTIEGNYKIRISDVDNIATDISSSEFVIIKPSFTKPILSTNRVLHGIPVTITWDYKLDIGNVRIELWKNTSIEKIGELTVEPKKSFSWTFPLKIDGVKNDVSGTDYTIKIFDTNENADPKESDTFEIIAPEFKTLKLPTSIDQNKTYNIEWDYSGNISNVKIQYIDTTNSIIIHDSIIRESIIASEKQIEWKPPLSSTVHGLDFKILITDVSGNATEKESNQFTLVRPKFNKIELFHPIDDLCVNFNSNEIYLSCPVDISWNTNNVTIDKVKIDIRRNDTSIFSSVVNTHNFDNNILTDDIFIYRLESETKLSDIGDDNFEDYYIKITDEAGNAEDISSSHIKIVKSLFKSIEFFDIENTKITDISQNIQVKIKWVYNLETDNTATISIINSDGSVRQVIKNNVNIQDASYNWVPDLSNSMAGKFKIKINDNSNPEHLVNTEITIIKPSFTILTLPTRVLHGISSDINWSHLLTMESVKIQLVNPNNLITSIENSVIVEGDSSYPWIFPLKIDGINNNVSGKGFKIKITDLSGFADDIVSNPFELIYPKFQNLLLNTVYQEIPNTINWDYSGNISNVKLELWDDTKVMDISINDSNIINTENCKECNLQWTMDNSKNIFGDYQIKIFDVSDNASNISSNVTIVKPIFKTIKIDNVYLMQEQNTQIRWVTNGLRIDTTRIELWDEPTHTRVKDISINNLNIKNTTQNTISFSSKEYNIPFVQENHKDICGNYFLKIFDVSDIAIDISSTAFIIEKPYFTLLDINQQNKQGDRVEISWNFKANIKNIKLEITKGEVLNEVKSTLNSENQEQRIYEWDILFNDLSGTGYKIKITDLSNIANDFYSNEFEIIAPKLTSFTVPNPIYQNRPYNLQWDYIGNIDTVNIKLKDEIGNLSDVSDSITANKKTFEWSPDLSKNMFGVFTLIISDNATHQNATTLPSNTFTIIKPKFNQIELIHKNASTLCIQNAPNTVYQECPIDISWNTNNSTIDEIRLELWRNIGSTENIKIKTIKNNKNTSGNANNTKLNDDTFKFSWTQDNSANAIHNDYYIRLFDVKDIANDISSSNFTIVKPKFLDISCNSIVHQGEINRITFDFDLSINNVKIDISSNTFKMTIAPNEIASHKFFDWSTILHKDMFGIFKLHIYDVDNIANDISSSTFEIKKATLGPIQLVDLDTPTVTVNQTVPINIVWDRFLHIENIKISLTNDIITNDILPYNILPQDSIPGNNNFDDFEKSKNNYLWTPILSNDMVGQKFRLNIIDLSDISVPKNNNALSTNSFTIIKPIFTNLVVPSTVNQGFASIITWNTNGLTLNNIRLELWDNDKIKDISPTISTPNIDPITENTFSWIPDLSSVSVGSGFKLKIIDLSGFADTINSNITINKNKFTSVNIAERVNQDEVTQITWNYDLSVNNIQLELWTTSKQQIITTQKASLKTFNWTPDLSNNSGEYKIVIKDVDSITEDYSSNIFTLVKPSFTKIKVPKNITQNFEFTITWTHKLTIENIILEFYDSNDVKFKTVSKVNNNIYIWKPIINDEMGKGFYVKIRDSAGNADEIPSNTFQIVKYSFNPVLYFNNPLNSKNGVNSIEFFRETRDGVLVNVYKLKRSVTITRIDTSIDTIPNTGHIVLEGNDVFDGSGNTISFFIDSDNVQGLFSCHPGDMSNNHLERKGFLIEKLRIVPPGNKFSRGKLDNLHSPFINYESVKNNRLWCTIKDCEMEKGQYNIANQKYGAPFFGDLSYNKYNGGYTRLENCISKWLPSGLIKNTNVSENPSAFVSNGFGENVNTDISNIGIMIHCIAVGIGDSTNLAIIKNFNVGIDNSKLKIINSYYLSQFTNNNGVIISSSIINGDTSEEIKILYDVP
jgi:hypothetical protein